DVMHITWEGGRTDSARVTLRLVRDGTIDTTTIVTDLLDTGSYDWEVPSSVVYGNDCRVEVMHTAGYYKVDYRDVGKDKSDGTITMLGAGGGGDGCPFVDVLSDSGWSAENTILGRALSGTLVRDAYRVKAHADGTAGRYRVRIRENETEATTLDQA